MNEAVPLDQYCQQVEAYLCRKNDGHLLRIVGPSFEVVRAWAEAGIPIKVALGGIDRTFERYYRKGPRRRPVKIDFCDADVQDAFDEWRRAVLTVGAAGAAAGEAPASAPDRRGPSLRAHLERVLHKFSQGRANGTLDDSFDPLIDRASHAFDQARGDGRGVRGDARTALIANLATLDADLMRHARGAAAPADLAAVEAEATAELAPYRPSMPGDAYARAFSGAVERLLRQRLGLPTISF